LVVERLVVLGFGVRIARASAAEAPSFAFVCVKVHVRVVQLGQILIGENLLNLWVQVNGNRASP